MSFFLTTAALTFKRLSRRPATVLTALLLVAASLLGSLFYAGEEEVLGIRVGVVHEKDDPFAEAVFARLLKQESPVLFEGFPLAEREAVESMVITGDLECAYILVPGLRERIVYGRARHAITLLTSPRSVLDALSSEMVYAAVLAEKVEDMTAELLRDTLGYSPDRAAQAAAGQIARYKDEDIFLEPEFSYLQTGGGAAEESSLPPEGSRLLHGVIALLLLGGTLWAIPSLLRETPGITGALPSSHARFYLFGVAAAVFLVQLVTGLFALFVISLAYPAALGSFFSEVCSLLFYALSLGLCGAAAARLLKKDDFVYGGGIFLMILTALLGGVMLDLAEIGPVPGMIGRLFPTAGYLAMAMGTAEPVDGVALLVAACLGAAVLALPRTTARK